MAPSTKTPYPTEQAYQAACTTAAAAAAAYYNTDTVEIDDATYDELTARIAATEAQHPTWRGGTGLDVHAVAGGVAIGGDIIHQHAMLSLENAMDDTELAAWFERFERLAGTGVALCVEPKLDGLAISATYRDGVLVQVATRGDGTRGEDVTMQAHGVRGLPTTCAQRDPFEVRGEIYMTDADFAAANALRVGAGKDAFKNPRNAAAGSLRNTSDTVRHPLSFAAYDLVGATSHHAAMAMLADQGFAIAVDAAGMERDVAVGYDAVAARITDLGARRGALGFAIDGAVVKADQAAVRQVAGTTAKAPRWAIAYKYPPDARRTTVLGITVQVGRTGVLTPVAELAPVDVGGVTIRRATLSNPGEVARKDVRIGDTVWVRRAGEVIPEIVAVDLDCRTEHSTPWVAPSACPRCAGPIDNASKRWRCAGRTCGSLEALVFFAGRDAMDIDGLGDQVVQRLVDAGLVQRPSDLYDLTVDQIAGLERMGAQSAEALVARIGASRQQPTANVICALGIGMVGSKLARNLATVYPTLTALRAARRDVLEDIDGIGSVRAERIIEDLALLDDEIALLCAHGVGSSGPVPAAVAGGVWSGKTVVITGSIDGYDRRSAAVAAEALGATVAGSVSSRTDLLVVGTGGGGKRAKAETLGIEIIDGDAFIALVAANN